MTHMDAHKTGKFTTDQRVSNIELEDDDLDNHFNDDIAEFDMSLDGDDLENGNPEIDYYPGMRGGRHTFLGEPENWKYKVRRFFRKSSGMKISENAKKLVIGLSIFCLAMIFFSVMFFTGNGSDKNIAGGAIHASDPVGESDAPFDNPDPLSDNTKSNSNTEEQVDPEKMTLNDMRQGHFWVRGLHINFIDYVPDADTDAKAESVISKRDHDDDDDDDDDDDNDDDDDDDKHDDEGKKKKEKEESSKHEKQNDDNKKKQTEKEEGVSLNEKEKETDSSEQSTNPEPSKDDGHYLHQIESVVWLKKAADTAYGKKIIDLASVVYNGIQLQSNLVSVSKSLNKIIISTDPRSQWRHSSYAKYWLVDVKTLEVEPVYYLTKKENEVESILPVELSYAAFSPDNKYIYFNYEGNLMLKNIETKKVTKVTKDGNLKDTFNGKPDWVYEEEVLGSDRAIYWAKDGSKFAFIKWNDKDVPVYNLEIFGNDKYPKIDKLKYPKPGFANPLISLHVYNVEKSKLIEVKQPEDDYSLGEDFIIYQTVWLNENELLFKRTDRTSRKIQVCLYDVKSGKTSVVRLINTEDYKGWYKNNGDMFVLPDNQGYIDTVVHENHDHLAHFKNSTDSEGDLVTSGDWDVIGGVSGYDESNKFVYFIGTYGNSLQRQLYQISLDGEVLTGLTQLDEIHSYSIQISTSGRWGLLNYLGPQLPTQKMVELTQLVAGDYYSGLSNLNNADEIASLLEKFQVPEKNYFQIELHDNVKVNVVEVKPSNFDENRKYPLLVSIYGGPGIQKVNCEFNYGFEEVVSSSMEAVVLYIDPRGTGGSGWDYKSWARNNIGYWEPRDITEATERYINDRGSFIDTERVAIWGWSYGGFTTLKTLEFDQGEVFKFGMAVAPVTNWYLYDSIYTERYMGLPSEENPYKDAKITNVSNFNKIYRFLIMHGTADDNVHYQNTLQLLNEFNLNGIENYDVHVFTDSDHSITHDNANVIVYDKLFDWLSTAFNT